MSRHKTLVGTEIVLILGLVGFVAAMVGVEHTAPGPARLGPLAALAFAAVPSVFWLGYFYLQDRNEPEPKQLVFGVFILGAFVASPIASFAASALPVASTDLDPLSMHRVLTNILVIGMVQEMAKYAVVRASIYRHAEFDEPMDGIIYMMAAGIGFAAAQNFRHLESLGGNVVLSQAAMNMVITTLAHACFAGVLGYALGLAKFSQASPVARGAQLFIGLCAAAVLNGVFAALEDRVLLAGVNAGAAWRGLAWAAGFAAVVFFAVSLLMKRQLARSPFGREAAGAMPGTISGATRTGGAPRGQAHDPLVLAAGAALVALGALVQPRADAQATYATLERDGLAVRYPRSAQWVPPTGTGYPAIIASAQCSSDPRATCANQPTARIAVRVYDDGMGLGQAQAGKDHDAEYGDRARRVLAAEAPRDIAGKAWKCMRFAYVPGDARSEIVAIECSLVSGKKLYVVTLAGPEPYASTLEPDVIGTLTVTTGGS